MPRSSSARSKCWTTGPGLRRGDVRAAALGGGLLPPSNRRGHGGGPAGEPARGRARGAERRRALALTAAGRLELESEGARRAPRRRALLARLAEGAALGRDLGSPSRERSFGLWRSAAGPRPSAGRRSGAHRAAPERGRAHRRAGRGTQGDPRVARPVRGASALWRHGQRQDRGVSAGHRGGARAEEPSGARGQALVLVPEIALTPSARRAFRAALQRRRRRAAFGPRPQASAAMPGGPLTAARRASSSARARRCSPRSRRCASSWWTRSTTRPTSSRRDFATRPAISPSGARSVRRCRSILGSATPSLETLENVAHGALLASSSCRSGRAPRGHRAWISSTCASTRASRDSRSPRCRRSAGICKDGGQVIMFLNRRGYAPSLFCSSLRLGRAMRALRCAHDPASARRASCAAITAARAPAVPDVCGKCGQPVHPRRPGHRARRGDPRRACSLRRRSRGSTAIRRVRTAPCRRCSSASTAARRGS